MSALEFAIEHGFRRFFFGLRLLLGWLLLCVPLAAICYYVAFRNGLADPAALSVPARAVIGILVVAILLAVMSISVNWHRRILLDETPSGLAWWRLGAVVWRYLFNVIVTLTILAIFAAAMAAMITIGIPALEPKLATAAKPMGNAVAGITGLVALLVGYRLCIKLPAVAVGDRKFGFGRAWRATRKNTWRYLGFTFWLLFMLAIAGAIAGGAAFAGQKLENLWVTVAGMTTAAVIALLTVFILLSVATSHYRFFGEGKEFPSDD